MALTKKGTVYLVGAGPGDSGLLTLKARDCIGKADVIIYDHLANKIFLRYAQKDAERIYVGKKGGSHTMAQKDINKLICDKAENGLNVVRLKGGDPFIFGRGGEEAMELIKKSISFEIIPGITSAIAVPAYAGIPLTHRDYSSTVAFITGHEDAAKEQSAIKWDRLATGVDTLVFLMGIGNLGSIAGKLLRNGRSPDTPVAVIHLGTTSKQKSIEGNLDNIADLAKKEGITPPGIIIVGEVVNLRAKLNWFEQRPLFGKKIIITRAREQASNFLSLLTESGADCIEFPTIEIMPPGSRKYMENAVKELKNYHWILFTSVNGVKYFFNTIYELGKDIRSLGHIKVGAIGPKTALAVRERGIIPDLVPDEYRAEAIVEDLREIGAEGLKILIPRAAKAREILPEELKKMGARVDVVEAYRTLMPTTDVDNIKDLFKQAKIDMVTFTSSSTVTNFMSMFDEEGDRINQWLERVTIACIGPITAETAKKYGLEVKIIPGEYTINALADAIIKFYS